MAKGRRTRWISLLEATRREDAKIEIKRAQNGLTTTQRAAAMESQRIEHELANHTTALFRLPGEIRNQIYDLVLPPHRSLKLDFPVKSGGEKLPNCAIFQICRLLRQEATSMYYDLAVTYTYTVSAPLLRHIGRKHNDEVLRFSGEHAAKF